MQCLRWPLADGLDDSDENHGTNEGDEETPDIEPADVTSDTEEAEDPAPESGADNTNDDIEEDALLAIGTHDHGCDPADETSEDDINEKTHKNVCDELLILLIELGGRFWCGDRFPHHEQFDETPGYDIVDEHREDGRPLKNTARCLGGTKDSDKGRSEGCCDQIDEAGKPGFSVGTKEFQDETERQENLDQSQNVPNNLRATVERLCAAG